MQKHVEVYLKAFNYIEGDFIPCESCGLRGVDIHHIIPRSKFGKKRKDEQDLITNLICLCRLCHEKAHSINNKEYLTVIHLANLSRLI